MSDNEPFAGGWSIPKMVEKLWTDFYHGNGKPGIVTRVKDVEDETARLERLKCDSADYANLEDRVTTLENYNKDRDNRLHTRINLLIGAVFSLAVAIVVQLLLRK